MRDYYYGSYYDDVDDMPDMESEKEHTGLFIGKVLETAETVKAALETLLMNWSMRRQIFETARWKFFANNPLGCGILNRMEKLHKRFPNSRIVNHLLGYCLPF